MSSSTDTAPHTETLSGFVQRGWRDHAERPVEVLERLPAGLDLVRAAGDPPGLAGLIVHVAGDHLGRWEDGLALLERLRAHPVCGAEPTARAAVERGRAVLLTCAGRTAEAATAQAAGHPAGLPEASTRGRVLAGVASALLGQRRLPEAVAAFREAVALAGYGPAADDPLVRALAVTGNNLACELEETPDRTPEQDALLELAARTARAQWERCGTWTNVYLAEYRLVMTCLALGRPAAALEHAGEALRLCQANQAGAFDLLFAWEALTRARHAAGDRSGAVEAAAQARAQLGGVDQDSRAYAVETLERLDALLAG